MSDYIPYGYCKCGCGQMTRPARDTNPKRGDTKGEPVKYMRGHNRHLQTFTPEQIEKQIAHFRGTHKSEECKRKIGEANSKKKYSKEEMNERVKARYGRELIYSPFIDGLVITPVTRHGTKRWYCRNEEMPSKHRKCGCTTTHAKAVYEKFIGKVPPGYKVHHKNGDPSKPENDAPENLMILSNKWNLYYMPILSKGFDIHESLVTEAYLSIVNIVPDEVLFQELCKVIIKKHYDGKAKNSHIQYEESNAHPPS